MAKEIKKVSLELNGSNGTNLKKEFTREHAERLLSRQEKRGSDNWKITDTKNLIFKDGNIIRRPSKSDFTEQSEAERNTGLPKA